MYLSIGGINIRVQSDDPEFIKKSQQEFEEFLCFERPAGCFELFVRQGYAVRASGPIKVERQDSKFLITADEFTASLDQDQRRAELDMADLRGVLNCFLRIFYSIILLEFDGFLVHSAGLAQGNKGFLFAGQSESGKTTAARMAADLQVLSDELVIVRKVREKIFLFSTPFKGEYQSIIKNKTAELKALAFLNRDIGQAAEKLSLIESFSKLMANTFFFAWDESSNQRLINTVTFVCRQIQAYDVDLFNHSIRSVINGISEQTYQEQESSLAAG